MFTTFLVLLFSNLSFTNTSIQELLQWYNTHPFIYILAIQDIIFGALVLFRLFNELTVIEKEAEEQDFWTCRNDLNIWEKHNDKH